MHRHIRVAVPQQSLFIRNRNATEDQAAPFHQAVHIVSMSDSQLHLCSFLSLPDKIRPAMIRSSGVVILMFS